ncbi:50S ribosomal protein L23 [Candidatus Saccharibacteria bacterium]|nr:50S ribosomal protein L23 [Candidatus Saccharibacteria bacterium]
MAKAEKTTKAKAAEVVKPTYLPRATEKAYFEQAKRTYIFVCPLDAAKAEIAKMVSKEYNVTVEDVRVLTRKGKKTRFSRGKHAYPGTTFRRDHKFAYVTLKEGDKIAVFEEPEEKTSSDKKADKKADKAEKKADKKAVKAEKKGDK